MDEELKILLRPIFYNPDIKIYCLDEPLADVIIENNRIRFDFGCCHPSKCLNGSDVIEIIKEADAYIDNATVWLEIEYDQSCFESIYEDAPLSDCYNNGDEIIIECNKKFNLRYRRNN